MATQPPPKAVRGTANDQPAQLDPNGVLVNPNPFLYQAKHELEFSNDHPCGIKESPWTPAHHSDFYPDKKTLQAKSLANLKEYIPTRLEFTFPHAPEGTERSDEWFGRLIHELFSRVNTFCNGNIIRSQDLDFGGRFGKQPWLNPELDKKFKELVQEIACADPADGGWDSLLTDDTERRYIVMGVIAQVINANVFDELLFGADDKTKNILEFWDEKDLHKDGYTRKLDRVHNVRRLMPEEGDGILTQKFWRDVDRITFKLCKLLFPLFNRREPDDTEGPVNRTVPLTYNYQELYDIIAIAGYTSISMALSGSIFRIEFARPRELVNLDQEQFSEEIWERSKKAGQKADDEAMAKAQVDAHNLENLAKVAEDNPAIDKQAIKEQAEAARQNSQHPDYLKGPRTAKVKIVMWPNVRRYKPMGKPQDGWVATEGDRISTIIKSMVVYYAGRTDRKSEEAEAFSLKEHVRSEGGTWVDAVEDLLLKDTETLPEVRGVPPGIAKSVAKLIQGPS